LIFPNQSQRTLENPRPGSGCIHTQYVFKTLHGIPPFGFHEHRPDVYIRMVIDKSVSEMNVCVVMAGVNSVRRDPIYGTPWSHSG
jgi:hypothetical protein